MLPFFPLNTVVYPGEILNLHIFEPRYRQLVKDCETDSLNFGIPIHLDNRVQEIGTELQLLEVVKRYPDGQLDIRTQGIRPFRLTSFQNPWPNKLYAGGTVEWMEVGDTSSYTERLLLLQQVEELYKLMGLSLKLVPDEEFLSFKIGHKVGLSLRQEYALLSIENESGRITFLLDHLSRNIPVVREMERTKERIRMNGHFRNFDPLDF